VRGSGERRGRVVARVGSGHERASSYALRG
jgi:hypothetical protein